MDTFKKLAKKTYSLICFLFGLSFLSNLVTRRSIKILLYHRVSMHTDSEFRNYLRVSPDNFEKQIAYLLSRGYSFVSLEQAVHLLASHEPLPKRMVVITFDDGYRDVYENALPILQRHSIPAAIFPSVGAADSGNGIWIDEIADAVGNTREATLWFDDRSFDLATYEARRSCFNYLVEFLKFLPVEQMQEYIHRILGELRHDCSSNGNKRISLAWDEMRAISQTFGAHCVTHISLAHQSNETMEEEISNSKRRLDRELGQNTVFFAYPYGKAKHFSDYTIQCLKDKGFACALTAEEGCNKKGADLFRLRRIIIEGDDSMIDFYSKIAGTSIHRVLQKIKLLKSQRLV